MKQYSFCLTALLFGSVALAQDVLEPVVVTGNRVGGELAEGNVNVEVIGAERINELLGFVPGFASVASDSAGYGDILAVRGTANTIFFGGAGVGMSVDGLPSGDVFGYPTEFFDLAAATLHRGPQGAFFGRNAPGGMIEMRTLGSESLGQKLTAEYGSYDTLNFRFRSAGELSDGWSYAFQTYRKERDGYIQNVNPAVGGYNDDRRQFGALGNLYYNPSADLQVRFRAMVESTRDGSQRLSVLPGVASSYGPFIDSMRAQGPFQVSSNFEGVNEIDRRQFSIHLDQGLGWADFKSITALQTWELGPSTVDLDLSPIPAAQSSINQQQRLWSQEFRLESDQTKDLSWVAGMAYLNKRNEGLANRFFGTGEMTFENQYTGFDIEEESLALFGHVSWSDQANLTLLAGGRLEYIDTSISRNKTGAGNPFPSMFPLPPAFVGQSEGWYFSPTLGADYTLSSDVSVFARTSLGFKPEGFTAFSDNPATTAFDEEKSWETEVGVRYQSADQSVGGELRGYYKQIDDYQVNRSIPFTTDFIIINAERVEALGLEGELFWQPVSQLTLQATAGVSQIEFDRHSGLAGQDYSGNNVPFLPEFTASLGARYDFNDGYYAQATVRSVGTTYYDEANNADYSQKSYQVFDAELGYQAEDWSAAIFARNLLDEQYFTFVNDQIAAGALGDPKIIGVRVGVEF